jgi:hypothetical protein
MELSGSDQLTGSAEPLQIATGLDRFHDVRAAFRARHRVNADHRDQQQAPTYLDRRPLKLAGPPNPDQS